jgi:hypothetical protein
MAWTKLRGIGDLELNWIFLSILTAILVWGLSEYTFSHPFMNVQFFLSGLQTGLREPEDPAPVA